MSPVLADASLPGGFVFCHLDELTVLSIPLGPPARCAAAVEEALASVRKEIAIVSGFKHQQLALSLLHDCLSFGTAVYQMRLVEPSPEVLAVYASFDEVVTAAFSTITGVVPDPTALRVAADFYDAPVPVDVLLWQVGIRRGGLGLRSIARHAPLAYFGCLRQCVKKLHGPVVDSAFQHLPAFASFPFSVPGSSSPSSPNGDELRYLTHFSQPLLRFAAFREAFSGSVPADHSIAGRIASTIPQIPDDRLQRFLSRHLDLLDSKAIYDALNDVGKRRLKTLGCKSMGLAVYPQPSYLRAMHECKRPEPLLDNRQLHYSLRVRLGHTLCSEGGAHCLQCGRDVGDVDSHAMACMHGGYRSRCHNTMVTGIVHALQDLGFQASTERMVFSDQRRVDILTQVDGIWYALDVTVVSPLLSSAAGSAVATAEAVKVRKYKADCEGLGLVFVPAAFCMWGSRGAAFEEFLQRALKVSQRRHPHLCHSGLAVHSRIQMCLARAVGTLLAAKLAGVQPPGPERRFPTDDSG
jgi:hypothetical protein